MRYLLLGLLSALLAGGCREEPRGAASAPTSQPASWRVCFSPRGDCTRLIIETIAAARAGILVQAYSLTSRPIAQALIDAHQRGVSVAVLLDTSQRTERQALAAVLAEAAIPVFIDAAHRIAHNKVMVIDDDTVITGSFNFTRSAEEANAENLLVIHDRALAQRYRDNWDLHRRHAAPYRAVRSTPS